MSANTTQDPRSAIEKIDMRLVVLQHLLSHTNTDRMTDDLIMGMGKIVGDIQNDVIDLIQYRKDTADRYLDGKGITF